MPVDRELQSPVPDWKLIEVNNQVGQAAQAVGKKFRKQASVETFYHKIGPEPESHDAEMIDRVAMTNFPKDNQWQHREAVRVGFAVGLCLREKIAHVNPPEYYSESLDTMFVRFGQPDKYEKGDFVEYLGRARNSLQARIVRRDLPRELLRPFHCVINYIADDINAVYVGALSSLANEAVSVLQARLIRDTESPSNSEILSLAKVCEDDFDSLDVIDSAELARRRPHMHQKPPFES